MPREAKITYEQVAAAADALKSEGTKPTQRAVRERLGNIGNYGTISKHLQQWKGGEQRLAAVPLALPPGVQRAMLDYMAQELAINRAALEADVAELQQEVADLADDNERKADDIDSLTKENTACDLTLAAQEAVNECLATDLAAAQKDTATERAAAAEARLELAKAQLRLEAMPRLEQVITEVRADLDLARYARSSAEQEAAVLAARLEAALERAGKADTALAEAHDDIIVERATAEAARAQLAQARGEVVAERQARQTVEQLAAAVGAKLDAESARASATDAALMIARDEATRVRAELEHERLHASKARASMRPARQPKR